ncbi:hypothetical protein SynBIOSE41_02833 [Synechococcus sp. BIOS-E4-1]|nr:hypothetical protein SynBIOSE41_02833 [Synechococcus sp. BIOS-E4-1]
MSNTRDIFKRTSCDGDQKVQSVKKDIQYILCTCEIDSNNQ